MLLHVLLGLNGCRVIYPRLFHRGGQDKGNVGLRRATAFKDLAILTLGDHEPQYRNGVKCFSFFLSHLFLLVFYSFV